MKIAEQDGKRNGVEDPSIRSRMENQIQAGPVINSCSD